MEEVERSGALVGFPGERALQRGAWMTAGLIASRADAQRDAWRGQVLVDAGGVVWDGLTDVVVVGSGVAGLVAAMTAREAGVEVVVVAGSEAARRTSGDGLVAALPGLDAATHGLDGPALAVPLNGHNGFRDVLAPGRVGLRLDSVATASDLGLPGVGGFDLAWQAGVVDGLVVGEPGGPVLGVRLDGGEGPRFIRALRGVILTSTSAVPSHQDRDDDDGAGDGLVLGLAAGGEVADGLSATVGCPVAVIGTNDDVNGLWVNLAGERFIAEDAHHATAMRAIERQPDGAAWAIFDAATAALGGEVLGALAGGFSRDLADELALGLIVQATTLEALAFDLGVDPDGLLRTVAAWNDDMRSLGRDRRFGRQVALRPLGAGPFHGQRVTPVRLEAGGGLRVNTEAQVIDHRQHPIPGLYAAGSAAAAFIGTWYPRGGPRLAGLVLGRRAGAHAAGDFNPCPPEALARGLR